MTGNSDNFRNPSVRGNSNQPLHAVRDFLEQESISHAAVTVALSGGADSVCLLACLLRWRKAFHLDISAIHVQHNLRGEESRRDEQFCRQLCADWQVKLQVVSVDVKAYQAQHRLSTETAARECRYQAFSICGSDYLATAHTASDNLETMLFRFARGTGLKGMCGIPPRREAYIRPLLTVSRQEIEAFLHANQMTYITDSSNLEDVYNRNFIRHQICPLLERLTGNATQAACRMADIFRQEEDFLASAAQQAYQQAKQPDGSVKALHMLHPALQRRCIALFLEEAGISADYRHILQVQRLLADGGRAELVRDRITARVSHGILCLENTPASYAYPDNPVPEMHLRPGENRIFPDYLLTAEIICVKNPEEAEKIYKKSANSALDYAIIKKHSAGALLLHGRRPGMRIRLSGRTHSIQIKKWLQTLPVTERASVHYLSDENGLLWVQGLGVAERAAVTAKTKRILLLHVHRTDTECT